MQSYLVRRQVAGAHHRLSVFAGPDSDHRALCGLRTWESDAYAVEFETIELIGW